MKRIVAVLFLFAFSTLVYAEDWPAWRGPTGQGYSSEKNLPVKWSTKENVKWKVPLAYPANSTPIVWKDKVFLTMGTPEGKIRSLYCLSRADGKQLWQKDVKYPAKEQNWRDFPYCSASPVTDGERVIVSFGSAGLYCYDLDGKELWKRTDLGAWQHQFGNASSPILYQDLCIIYKGPAAKGPRGLLAVNKTNGKTVWDKQRDTMKEPTKDFGTWGTPIIVEIDGQDQLLYCSGYRLDGVDPKTGDHLWKCDGLMEYIYTSPLYSPKHEIAVAMSGFSKSALAVKVGGTGDITPNRLWHHPKNTQRVGSGIIIGAHVYIVEQTGVAKCYELQTGKEIWKAPKVAQFNWGSLVHADGLLYCLARNGDTVVMKASPKFELVATNRLSKGQETNSSPVISNGEIFLRTYQYLWCISEKK